MAPASLQGGAPTTNAHPGRMRGLGQVTYIGDYDYVFINRKWVRRWLGRMEGVNAQDWQRAETWVSYVVGFRKQKYFGSKVTKHVVCHGTVLC